MIDISVIDFTNKQTLLKKIEKRTTVFVNGERVVKPQNRRKISRLIPFRTQVFSYFGRFRVRKLSKTFSLFSGSFYDVYIN